jgi:hypothetical protein
MPNYNAELFCCQGCKEELGFPDFEKELRGFGSGDHGTGFHNSIDVNHKQGTEVQNLLWRTLNRD